MKSIVVIGAVMALAITAEALEVDGVAAKVGADTILRSEVLNELRSQGEMDATRFNEVRDRMIERKLIQQAAAEAKLSLEEWVIDNRVREVLTKSFNGDRNKLVEMLGQHKISYPEWRAKLKDDMVIYAMRYKVVDSNVTASPSAMRKEYAEHPERYSQDRKVSVSVIMLRPEEAERRGEIDQQLKAKSFVELGGVKYENVNPEDMFKPEIIKEIDSMPKGTISHWIMLEGWSYLLYKDAETTGRKLSFEEAYEQIEKSVKEQEQKRLYDEWIARLKDETYIKVF